VDGDRSRYTSLRLQDTEHFVRTGEPSDKVVRYGLIGDEEVVHTIAEAFGFVEMPAGFAAYEAPHGLCRSGNEAWRCQDCQAISNGARITVAKAVRGLLLQEIYLLGEISEQLVTLHVTA